MSTREIGSRRWPAGLRWLAPVLLIVGIASAMFVFFMTLAFVLGR